MGEPHERTIKFGCQAVKVRLVAFGHDQDMPRIQGPMVQKGQEVLVFIDGMAGDMPRHNRTKETGVVPRLHQLLSDRLLSSRSVPTTAPPTDPQHVISFATRFIIYAHKPLGYTQ